MISLEEFKRIELRVGEIVGAEPVPGSEAKAIALLTVNRPVSNGAVVA